MLLSNCIKHYRNKRDRALLEGRTASRSFLSFYWQTSVTVLIWRLFSSSGVKDKNFMLHYEVSDALLCMFISGCTVYWAFLSVSSVCDQWDRKGGRNQPARAGSRWVPLWCFPSVSQRCLMHVCVQERWRRRRWGPSSLQIYPSPSASRLRCWSPTVRCGASLAPLSRLMRMCPELMLCLCSVSTGSSSMASVCGGSLALMDAGMMHLFGTLCCWIEQAVMN